MSKPFFTTVKATSSTTTIRKDRSTQSFRGANNGRIINPDQYRPSKEPAYMTNNYGGNF